jgi:hypothetical protein
MLPNKAYIVLEFLITDKGITKFTGFSMFIPPFTPGAFITIPAELNPFLINSTSIPFSLTARLMKLQPTRILNSLLHPPHLALTRAMVRGTKPTRQSADSYSPPLNIHASHPDVLSFHNKQSIDAKKVGCLVKHGSR